MLLKSIPRGQAKGAQHGDLSVNTGRVRFVCHFLLKQRSDLSHNPSKYLCTRNEATRERYAFENLLKVYSNTVFSVNDMGKNNLHRYLSSQFQGAVLLECTQKSTGRDKYFGHHSTRVCTPITRLSWRFVADRRSLMQLPNPSVPQFSQGPVSSFSHTRASETMVYPSTKERLHLRRSLCPESFTFLDLWKRGPGRSELIIAPNSVDNLNYGFTRRVSARCDV